MDAFLFGNSESPLWAVYHPANFSVDRFEGVVLCYPFGQEYMRSHWAMRQLASMLAQKGFHVLRFDYRGTGDSSLDLDQVTPEFWINDIDSAISELKDLTGVEKISLVGLRLGALLAATVATQRSDVGSLVVWDPIISGQKYIDELTLSIGGARDEGLNSNYIGADNTIHFNGFALSRDFQKGLIDIDLENNQVPDCRSLELVSHENTHFTCLKNSWQKNPNFEYKEVPSPNDWNYVDNIGGILLPQNILKAICDWI